jgi:hypothetical protein
MDQAAKDRIVAGWLTLPEELRSRPATEEQIHDFEKAFGPIPQDFRWFLSTLGGGPVGPEWVDDIGQLPFTHERFAEESDFWRMRGIFLIGWDGAGNRYGIDRMTGRVLVEDHNFGGIHKMAPSLESFLTKGLCED